MSVETVTRRKDGGQNEDKIRVKSKHCDDQPPCSNWIVSGLGSANPLGYRCIIQAAEKFADLAQRFASTFPNHPHRHILSLQASFAGRDQALPIYSVFLCHSLPYFLRNSSSNFT